MNSNVAAFAQWKYPTPDEETPQKTGFGATATFPEGTNVPFAEALISMGEELTKKYYDPATMYCKIDILGVSASSNMTRLTICRSSLHARFARVPASRSGATTYG